MSRGSLLDYAEALRTGSRLKDARRWRKRLKAEHPTLIWALEEEMPQQHVEAVKGPARPQHQKRPQRGKGPPRPGQIRHLRALERRLRRKPYEPPTEHLARIEIKRLEQVLRTLEAVTGEIA